MLPLILIILASYLLGSIPFGYLVARWKGVDILHQGSGNIGATNVGRILGRPLGISVFLLDLSKGAIPVATANWITGHGGLDLPENTLEVFAGLAAFLGHLFPVFLGFRGGKGVATGAGIIFILLPGPALAALLTWLAVVCLCRYVSLASLTAAIMLCVVRLATTSDPFGEKERILTLFCLVVGGLVILRHHANISRLVRGSENRLKDSAGIELLTKTIHVLALGLWFGSAVFFSFVGTPVIFHAFGSLPAKEPPDRPAWLPSTLSKQQGNELAGLAVGPIFPWYFLLEGVCGVLALSTALSWSRSVRHFAVHQLRFLILVLALATVLAGWPIAERVADFRKDRYSADATIAANAEQSFVTWHICSLGLNLVTVGLVSVAMALAAKLPECQSSVKDELSEDRI